MLFTSLYLIAFRIVLLVLLLKYLLYPLYAPPGLGWVLVDIWVSYLYYYWCLVGCGPGDYPLPFNRGACTLGAPIFTLIAFGSTSNFPSGITLCHKIKIFHQYMALSWVDTTIGPGSTLTCGGYHCGWWHWLVLGAFCNHSGCWGLSCGNSLAWASCPTYSCLF